MCYDLTLPPLNRILSITHNTQTLDLNSIEILDTKYYVSISDFYVGKGGDGVDAFMCERAIGDHKVLISDCVVEYLRTCVDVLEGEQPGRFVSVTRRH